MEVPEPGKGWTPSVKHPGLPHIDVGFLGVPPKVITATGEHPSLCTNNSKTVMFKNKDLQTYRGVEKHGDVQKHNDIQKQRCSKTEMFKNNVVQM